MRAKVLFVAALLVVCFTMTASAQVAWNVTAANYQVVVGGKAEVIGGITWTVGSAAGGLQTSTITVNYGLTFTNAAFSETGKVIATPAAGIRTVTYTNGVVVTLRGTLATSLTDVAVSGSGTQLNLGIAPSAATVAVGDQISLDGIRADVSALAVGQTVDAVISSTPPSANTYNPAVIRVATVLNSFVLKGVTAGAAVICTAVGTTPIGVTVQEAFAGAFVQYTPDSGFRRLPRAGGNANTQFTLTVSNLPSGVTISWGTPVSGGTNMGSFALKSGWTSTSATYIFTAGVDSDANIETFTFPGTINLTTAAAAGTATITVQFGPVDEPDSTTVPRFISTPVDGGTVLTVNKCVTNLLYPYIVKGFGGYDTGIAVANTSFDTGAIPTDKGANNQSGPVTFYLYQKFAAGQTVAVSPMTFTTGTVGAGDTYANVVSAMLPTTVTDFQGYVIGVANFQFAHGYAYVAFNMGQASGIAQGYVANIIPDFTSLSASRASAIASTGGETLEH